MKINRAPIFFLLTLTLILVSFSMIPNASAINPQRDALLGKTWNGREAGGAWSFKWKRQGKTNVFSGTWRGPGGATLSGAVTINVNERNNTVTVSRPAIGGVSCTYSGNISLGRASGSYSCSNGYTGPWNASIATY